MGPKEQVASALASAPMYVRTLHRDDDATTFRVTFDMRLEADMVSIIDEVATRHNHSVGAQIYTYVKDTLRRWRPVKPKPSFADQVTAKIAARYGE